MSNPIKVSEEAADHVQEVKATHSHLPSYLALPPGAETVKQSTQFPVNMPSSIFGDLYIQHDFFSLITFLRHGFSSFEQL